MTFEIRPYPEFSWSISRQRKLDQCPRGYFYTYYLGWNGWLQDAPTEARVAYRLGKLTSLDALLGQQIDVRARELEAAARAGEELPTAGELEGRTREALRRLWTRSREGRAAFEARPNKVTMLRSLYMGQDTQPEADRLNEKAGPSMRGLLATSHWERLGTCGPHGCVIIPDFAHFLWDGVKVFAAPDLAYVQGGGLHIIDWKTGREDDSQALQVLLQMWWALETLPELAERPRTATSRSAATWSTSPPAARSRWRRPPASASRPLRPCAPASPRCAPCSPTRSGTPRSRSRPSSAARAGCAAAATSHRCAPEPSAPRRRRACPRAGRRSCRRRRSSSASRRSSIT